VNILDYMIDAPDFPTPGVVFKDMAPLFKSIEALRYITKTLADPYRESNVDLITGIDARGFIFGAMLADELGVGFVPIRKPGKLPGKTISESYALEYGTDSIEIQADVITPGQRILMCDDVLATGGTMEAACKLVRELGGEIVAAVFVMEIDYLPGRATIEALGVEICSVEHLN